MTVVTEYGEIMINEYMDEWGFRKINGLLEDGRIIIVVVVVAVVVFKRLLMGVGL